MATPSPSLGLIKPRGIRTSVVKGSPWTPAEQAKVDDASAPDLFGTSIRPLEPAPYVVRYHYYCETNTCKGHDQKVLDWEVGQAGREWLRDYGKDRVTDAMLHKWRNQLLAPHNDVYFFVGNQNRRRRSFSVLGIWSPKKEDTLF